MLTFAFMHYPHLVCILFDMPSLHLFKSCSYQNGEHRLKKEIPLSKICYKYKKDIRKNMQKESNKRVILVLFTPLKVRIAPNVLQLLHMCFLSQILINNSIILSQARRVSSSSFDLLYCQLV